jgi:hypothetical protein
MITYLDGRGDQPVDPGYGVTPPMYPSHGLPGSPGYPSQGLPGSGGHPSHPIAGFPPGAVQLPVFPFDPTEKPDQGLPGEEAPDQGLPGQGGRPPKPTQPIYPTPGGRYLVKWLACVGLILVPDNSLPQTPEPK